ncbi:hypothetical protein N5E30_25545, partial [Pseudomonas chengduensis]
ITRAALKNRIQAYYWPKDGAEIGLFTNLMPLPPGYEDSPQIAHGGPFLESFQTEPFCLYDGPVPILDYFGFKNAVGRATPYPIGVTVAKDGKVVGACYRLGEKGEPVSVAAVDFLELTHIGHLAEFLADQNKLTARYPESLLGTATFGDQSFPIAGCAFTGGGSMEVEADQPQVAPEEPENESGALKTLAFAAYLIADLAERLDENAEFPSNKVRLKRAGKPNVNSIAKALEDTARKLKYDGHGYGKRGFQEALGKALKAME